MKKILLVDDDADILKLYGIALDGVGINLITSNNGKSGIAQAQSEQPDLILLDVMMPDMSGIQVLEALKSDDATKDIPVAMFTNYGDEKYIEDCMKKGAANYLVKSNYDPDDIVKELNKLMDSASE